jgi:hypothetical protein
MSMSTTSAAAKEQPWRAFWPPKAENYSEQQIQDMPWLGWKFDPSKAEEKPWREWVLKNQSGIARRGSTTHLTEF